MPVERGRPTPLGASRRDGGVNFAVFSSQATAATLVVRRASGAVEIQLDPAVHRTGNVWHALVKGVEPGVEYVWQLDGPHRPPRHRFDPRHQLVDPYARALSGAEQWGTEGGDPRPPAGVHAPSASAPLGRPRRSVFLDDGFDWSHDRHPDIHLADSVIYELHVRGFTRGAGAGVPHPGTFAGVIEKIPHLRELGVTAVELMPVTEFEELDNRRVDPRSGRRLVNYWGYDPINFFALKSAYAADSRGDGPAREFREMVRALHAAGIEVILDVVFNHTGEGDDEGPTYGFRGLDNSVYYMLDSRGEYLDYSGCGNTVNCNHPVVRDMILESLRYWVSEMHVDGFRFDLASILGRGPDGSVMSDPPVLERIALDPVLAGTKLIAEAWDAAGLYQVGSFPDWGRWAEWNGRFRDDVRRVVRGDPGMIPALATRLAGSSDLYRAGGRAPFHSINFVTCHDGFTLADLVCYNEPHNEANGERNRDGERENYSWNCGVEGPTDVVEIVRLRRRQVRNLATILFMSQGVPMIQAGDEFGRSQGGNNNAYCQDNETSWLDWRLLDENDELFRFFKLLVAFRRRHGILRRRRFFDGGLAGRNEILWHGTVIGRPDWSYESRVLAMQLFGGAGDIDLYLIVNAHWEARRFELPPCPGAKRWHRFVDTALDPPDDIVEEEQQPRLTNQQAYAAGPRSVVVLVGK